MPGRGLRLVRAHLGRDLLSARPAGAKVTAGKVANKVAKAWPSESRFKSIGYAKVAKVAKVLRGGVIMFNASSAAWRRSRHTAITRPEMRR